ncbi:DENN domain-containing protein 3 [Channa argus]|uniref:DENN domain-containing protein 3 n=1 Tax=Channa argus TaxID=215402 RepID=A0A6G1PP14_CHAAH|nr:DENN domain-containing protein 3 [Channa argus]
MVVVMMDHLAPALLEACVVIGASADKLQEVYQAKNNNLAAEHLLLEPEVLYVLSPPFVNRPQTESEAVRSLWKRRRSILRRKREQPPSATASSCQGLLHLLVSVHGGEAKEYEGSEDVSVPKDIDLMALPQLCFPGGLQVTSEQRDEEFHFLVFTDVFGNKTHGVVMQCYRPILEGASLYQNGAGSSKFSNLFCAYSFCVISQYPYFTALKDCLSCLSFCLFVSLLIQLRTCRLSDMEDRVKEFAAKLTLVPIPPPGQLHLVMSCLLQEQRVVLFSANWARLTLVAESLLLFLMPLSWQHPYVPVLSRGMLDFLMAPTAFLMGCHLSHFEEVASETDDLILINIDKGSVSTSNSDTLDVPDIPGAAADCFTQRDVSSHLNYEHRVFNSEEFLKTRQPDEQLFYKKVLETHIFHSFLKDRLNRKMDNYARMELSTRSEMQKMKAKIEVSHRPISQEIQAHGRSSVSESRLNKSLPNLRDDQTVNFHRNTPLTRIIMSEFALKIPSTPVKMLRLPDFPASLSFHCVQSYYNELVQQLGKAIFSVQNQNSALLARFYYLRGFINTLCSRRLDALSDFQKLYKTDADIFPTQLVTCLVDSLHQDERQQVEKRPELQRLILKVKTESEQPLVHHDDRVKKFVLPTQQMPQDEFVRCVLECGIVKDVATIHRLFDALADGQKIDPKLFADFYNVWKEMAAEAQDVHLPSEVIDHLENSEYVCKLSSRVKTSHGVGKIVMTQRRLFLLIEGQPGYLEITNFRDIQEVKIALAPFLLVRIPSLRIQTSGRLKAFEANLKTETELWNLVIKEMWAGRKMADQHKDPQYMTQALTNVLLMDAVMRCLQTQRSIINASKLAYFDKIRHEGQLNCSDSEGGMSPKLWVALSGGKVVVFDAASWCMMQGKPPDWQVTSGCGESIVELKKDGSSQRKLSLPDDPQSMPCGFSSFIIIPEQGQLWTGCANSGELCLWDTNNQRCLSKIVSLPGSSGVTCMIRVKKQIWVGCHRQSDVGGQCNSQLRSHVLVVDSEAHTVTKELQAHSDTIQALCSAEDRYVLSGSAYRDGKIAIWKVE